jgi:hypothetical protein
MSLDVIGAGFGRTGTTSLKLALEHLGFTRCHHMTEVRRHPETAVHWEAAAAGKPVDWEALLAGYRAVVDWPACYFYRELARVYPDAKVILTLRDPDAWFRSTQATIFRPEHAKRIENEPIAGVVRNTIWATFDGRQNDREHALAVYEQHISEVQRTIAPERLLVYDVAEGWEPLCGFLGVPIPGEPFPHANTSADFRRGQPLPGLTLPVSASSASK